MTVRVDPVLFKEAMRLTASGVAVLTTDGPFGAAGLTVSTLQSLSAAPPSVVVCVNDASRSLTALLGNGRFVANVLSSDQEHIAAAFARPSDDARSGQFASGAWRFMALEGMPALERAVCSFACGVASVFAYGSHKIVVGEVLTIQTGSGAPLIYSNRAYHRLSDPISPVSGKSPPDPFARIANG